MSVRGARRHTAQHVEKEGRICVEAVLAAAGGHNDDGHNHDHDPDDDGTVSECMEESKKGQN